MALFDWLFGRSPEPLQRSQPPLATPEIREPKIERTENRPRFPHAHRVPDGSFRFIALDVETACSDAASICQIGLACVQPSYE